MAHLASSALFPAPAPPKKDPNEGTFTLSSYLRTVFKQFDVRVPHTRSLSL